MKVLMVSMDRNIFDEKSDAGARMVFLASIVEELHIIVMSLESDGLESMQLEDNVFVYPTDSKTRWHYLHDAFRIGKGLVDIDLVTAQDPSELGSIALRLGRFHNVGVELQVHADIFSPRYRRSSLMHRFRTQLAKHNLRQTDSIRVVSDRIRRSLLVHVAQRRHRTPVHILPVFVDIECVQRGRVSVDLHEQHSEFDFIVLLAARLVEEKNVAGALDAFARVVAEYPRAGMVIVGDGPLLYALRQKTVNLGIEKQAIFEGWSDDVVSFMKTADAFVVTSEYEGYGRTLVEAALVGCPVVTTDVGIAGGVLHDGQEALVCPVGDMDCVAKQLLHIAKDERLRKLLVDNARRVSQNHVLGAQHYLATLKSTWESCVS